MAMHVEADVYSSITEMYQIAPNALEVVTANRRTIRITAMEKIRGPLANYWASYDELVPTTIGGESVEVWAHAEFPSANGRTVEQCLRFALGFVDEAGAQASE